MKQYAIGNAAFVLVITGCATPTAIPAALAKPAPAPAAVSAPIKPFVAATRYDGPGHAFATAVQLSGVSNPLAFSQKQQEWLWLNYRDWTKQGQALREQDGVRYDEVTLVNRNGETRVLYFRMPKGVKP